MNKLLTACTVATVVMLAAPAYADAPRFGYVDVRKVVIESKAGKQARTELEKLAEQKKDQLLKEEQKLQSLKKDFEKNHLVMNDQQKQEKQKEFQEKLQALQKMEVEAKQELGKKDAELTQKALRELQAIVAEIAKEQKLMMVFDKGAQPLYAEPGPDLTDKVLQKYDAKGGK